MNVRQLIAALEKIEDKDRLIYAKNGNRSGGCCGDSGEPDWDEVVSVDESMVEERAYSKDKGMYWKNINVVNLDVY